MATSSSLFKLLTQGCRFDQKKSESFEQFGERADGSAGADLVSRTSGSPGRGVPAAAPTSSSPSPSRSTRRPSDQSSATGSSLVGAGGVSQATSVKIWGSGKVQPFSEWSELPVPAWLVKSVCDDAGFARPTTVQQYAVPAVLSGRDVLAFAPTGSGKTLAFLLPLLARLSADEPASLSKQDAAGREGPRALLLAPTRELARQTYVQLLRFEGNRDDAAGQVDGQPAPVDGEGPRTKKRKKKTGPERVEERGGRRRLLKSVFLTKENCSPKSLADPVDVVVSTPMRAVRALKKGWLRLGQLQFLVFDEADRLFDPELGQFLPQVDEIITACRQQRESLSGGAPPSPSALQICLYSATIQPAIEELARTVLRSPVKILVGSRNVVAPDVDQSLLFCGSEEGKLLAVKQLLLQTAASTAASAGSACVVPPVLLFVQSKQRADDLYRTLRLEQVPRVGVLHGALPQERRDETVRQFRSGDLWVLVCTELVARGMDFRAVNAVINYDFPQTVTSYVHRVGRAGRAGRRGVAVTLFTKQDHELLRSIAAVMRESGRRRNAKN